MFFDSHAHVNFKAFDDAQDVITRALVNDTWVINVGSQLGTSKRAIELAQKQKEGVYASVGLHPIHISQEELEYDEEYPKEKYTIDDLEKVLSRVREMASNDKVVAIGEVGLDYFHFPQNCDIEKIKQWQKTYLKEFIKLADELNKPLILHCRASKEKPKEAYRDLLEILGEFFGVSLLGGVENNQTPQPPLSGGLSDDHPPQPPLSGGLSDDQTPQPPLSGGRTFDTPLIRGARGVSGSGGSGASRHNGVIHCFGSNLEIAKEFIKLGFKIGFTGIVTFKNAIELQDVARGIELKDILIETDCPYLAPEPFRGKRNEPIYVKYIAQKIAELKGVDVKEIESVTFENTKELLDLTK